MVNLTVNQVFNGKGNQMKEMNETKKTNKMKKITALFIGMLLSGMVASAQTNFLDVHYIEVAGTAEMEVVPDRIYLKIVIDEKDNKLKTGINKLEEDMIAALKTIDGINVSEDLTMKDLGSSLQYRIIADNQILYRKEYELLVKDGKTASEVIAKLDKAGISKISLARIDHSQMVAFRKTVRENAIKAAKEKATYLAEAIGQSIGKAIYISEIPQIVSVSNTSGGRGYSSNFASKSSGSDGYFNSEVEFSKIKIQFTIEVKFELK